MSMNEQQQIYASVDLELSGFDPEADEIIEIGILRFHIVAGKLIVLDSFESLVRPTGEIRARVLGLTGIDAGAAEHAPQWEEVKEKVQAFLNDAVILGHGVDLDRKFLEAKGIVLKSDTIDTLELSQIFLPTHHSYNLENLAHELRVSHTTAHRALADAEATFGVLSQLVGVYQKLPQVVKKRIYDIAQSRGLFWATVFASATAPIPVLVAPEVKAAPLPSLPVVRQTAMVVTSLGNPALPRFEEMRTHIPTWALSLAERERVLAIARSVPAEPYLGAFESVSKNALDALLDRSTELSAREITALLKVLVWQAQGTAHGILAELNWSIIGTELKRLFSAGFLSHTPAGVALTDFRSLPDFKDGRNIWIDQTDSYIQFLEQKSGMQLSWHAMIAGLRQIYNPETAFGDVSKSGQVLGAIAALDVFFARVLLLIKQEHHTTAGVLSPEDLGGYVWDAIMQAAINLRQKLKDIFPNSREVAVTRIVESLGTYFAHEYTESEVRWVEFSDTRCTFVLRPTNLVHAFQQSVGGRRIVALQTDVANTVLQNYFMDRLGMKVPVSKPEYEVRSLSCAKKLTVTDESEELEVTRRLAAIKNTIILFPTVEKLKDYYDTKYAKLSSPPPVAAVSIHGGVNKVLRNFEHNSKAVILAALPSLLSYAASPLEIENIIYVGVPSVDVRHPYHARLAKEYFSSVQQYHEHAQLLCFIQSLRIFNMHSVNMVEIIVTEHNKDVGTFLLDQAFVGV